PPGRHPGDRRDDGDVGPGGRPVTEVRHFLTMADLSAAELDQVLTDAQALAENRAVTADLAGRTVGLLFEKPSTRTRVSFHVAVAELGGTPLPLSADDLQLGRG